MIDRRAFIAANIAGLALAANYPRMSWAAPITNKRFVFILQRGAADGLAIVAPTGDPDYIRARGDAGASLDGNKLDILFTLHPELVEAAAMFRAGQASFAHAVASGYRERSHFDGQNILESGATIPYARSDGWMNRLLTLLPSSEAKAMAIAPSVPLILRGASAASSFERSRKQGVDDELKQRVAMLYAEDAELHSLWESALENDAMAGVQDTSMRGGASVGNMAANLMAGINGARVLMLESNGWDTHNQQNGRLNLLLKQTDALIAALRDGLGAEWRDTLVLVATEFGRTVAFNGTGGSDHGTASAAMLFGGSLKNGGIVVADWPGMAVNKLYEGRDLRPTIRFENVVVDALSHHYAIDPVNMKRTLFPDFI